MGVGLALLANSRPYEGLLVSVPAGVMLLAWMARKRGPALWASIKTVIMPLLFVLAITATGMGLYNLRVTGSVLRMPYQVHEEIYAIAPKFIWQPLRSEPIYRHDLIRDAHRGVDVTLYKLERTPLGFGAKNVVFLLWWIIYSLNVLLIPVVVMFSIMLPWILRKGWGRFALLTYGLLICGVFMEVPLMIHYFAPITSVNYVFVLNALQLWKRQSGKREVRPLVLCLGAITLAACFYMRPNVAAPSLWHRHRAGILEQLKKAEGDHLIMVRYGPNQSVHEEWVYNESDIDRSKVVWARDMDMDQNCKLVEYFRTRHIWSLQLDGQSSILELKPYQTSLCK
jgi:hypothetical protein